MSRLNQSRGRRALIGKASAIAISTGIMWSSPALAQQDSENEQSAPQVATSSSTDNEFDDSVAIIVTGVRGRPRSVLDSPTPVDVLSGEEIKDLGHANLYQDLQVIVPSFNQPSKAGSSTASAVLTGGLRGLNPDHTLVLVNGQRWHHTALINVGNGLYNGSVPVDLGMIPASAIERIEVLREGAAAQYGSDAIAGVINIILKDSPGGSISAQYGQNMDRSDGELYIIRGDYGFQYSEGGSLNLFFTLQEQNQSDRSYDLPADVTFYSPLPDGSPDPRESTIDRQISRGFGAFPFKHVQVGYNLNQSIGSAELYSFATFNRRLQDILYPPLLPKQNISLPEVFPNFAYPLFHIRESDAQVAVGLRGTKSDWDWNVSTTFGVNNAPLSISETLNASLGPTTPTEFYLGTLNSREWTNSLDLTKGLDLSGGGNLQVSFGLQHRHEGFKIKSGDPESYIIGDYVRPAGQAFAGVPLPGGAVFAPGFRPEDSGSWTRNVLSGYVELGFEPNDRLFLGAAGRVEHFDDSSGTSVVGKVDGRYKLTDSLAIRASFGNGFHAPSLVQQHYSNARVTASTAAATLGQVITNQILPVENPAAIALGAEPLRPEKSVDASVGFTFNPSASFSLTLDGYLVTVSDRIALGSILQGSAVSDILAANGIDPNLTGQYFTNAVDTRTIGADLIAIYKTALGNAGNLRLTAAVNLNHTKITDLAPNPPELDVLGSSYVAVNRVTQGYLTEGIPESKIALSANWNLGRFGFNLQQIRYGKFATPGATPTLDRFFPAQWITNAQVKYNFSDQVSVAVGADNLFNSYPPDTNIPLAQYGYNQYPRTSPYGFTGGFYYGRIQVDF